MELRAENNSQCRRNRKYISKENESICKQTWKTVGICMLAFVCYVKLMCICFLQTILIKVTKTRRKEQGKAMNWDERNERDIGVFEKK